MPVHEFKIIPSKWHVGLLSAALLGGLIIIGCIHITLWIRLPLFMIVWFYGARLLLTVGFLLTSQAILCIQRNAQGEWQLINRLGAETVKLCGSSTITNFVSVLRFRVIDKQRIKSCVVFMDSLAQDEYRKLRQLIAME